MNTILNSCQGKTRQTKFTPERLDQIKNLVERGTSREEIAAIIGCTVGTLQVTCSRFGISLRRPKFNTGVRVGPVREKADNTMSTNGFHGSTICVPPRTEAAPGVVRDVVVTLQIRHGHRERSVDLQLTPKMLERLAMEAWLRDMTMGDVIRDLLVSALNE